jgi:hypothetical protein
VNYFEPKPPSGLTPAHEVPAVRYTVIKNLHGPVAKQFSKVDGKLKVQPRANVWEGNHRQVTAKSVDEFVYGRRLDGIMHSDLCYVYAASVHLEGPLVQKNERWRFPGAIARCKEDLSFRNGEPGIVCIDYDPPKGTKPLTPHELREALCQAYPPLREVRMGIDNSSSSYISEVNGPEWIGAGGLRVFFFIDDESKKPQLMDYLFQGLWELGYGYIKITKSGKMLPRTLLDESFKNAPHLDFIAQSILTEDLVRTEPAGFPMFFGNAWALKTEGLPSPEDAATWRKDNPRVTAEKERRKPEADAVRGDWIKERLPRMLERVRSRKPDTTEAEVRKRLEKVADAETDGELDLDFELFLMDGTPITVEALLNELQMQCLIDGRNWIDVRDPLDPEYDGGRQVARAYYNTARDGKPESAWIKSYAHGEGKYSLMGALKALQALAFAATVRLPKTEPGCPQRPFAGETQKPEKPGLVVTCGADIKLEPIDWAWKDHFARGKLNLIGGPPGLGKSQLLLHIAKVITTGGTWPDGKQCRRGAVLLIQNEDNASDTVAPRAIAAGVDMNRFFIAGAIRVNEGDGIAERLIQLDRDLEAIEAALAALPGVDTLMIDPITAYLGKTDSYKDSEVRAVLTPLAALAERRGLMVIVLAHLNKASGRSASDRISGAPAFLQVPRTAHMVAFDPDDSELRIFQPFKRNLGKGFEGFAFRIVTETIPDPRYPAGIETSCIAWKGSKTLDDLGEALDGRQKEEHATRREEAKRFLQYELRDGPKPQQNLEYEAAALGIKTPTLRRAKKNLGVRSFRASDKSWWWALSGHTASAPIATPPGGIQMPNFH